MKRSEGQMTKYVTETLKSLLLGEGIVSQERLSVALTALQDEYLQDARHKIYVTVK